MSRLTPQDRRKLLVNIEKVAKNATEKYKLVATVSQNVNRNGLINRQAFSLLPTEVSDELMAHWLRENLFNQFDRQTVQRLSLAIKTASPGSSHNAGKGLNLVVGAKTAHFATSD